MEVIADLHLHSNYSRACSSRLTLGNNDAVAHAKGIKLIGTGDFTHPAHLADIKRDLEEAEPGLYKLKGSNTGVRFVLSTEVSTVFESNGKLKKVHHCILTPSIDAAEHINDALGKRADLSIDGRPTLSISAAELVENVLEADSSAFVFPAHAWTPWFGVLGSISGFDSIDEAYEDQAKHIYALETGLSSDPPMNWLVSKLDKYALISNSDAHSPEKIGREANMFDLKESEFSYGAIVNAIRNKDKRSLKMTIEFYPEEGKYHYDGHRNCNISLSPEEARKYNNICPVCGKRLTIGVLHRVIELADREEGYIPSSAIPYVHTVPLKEVISYITKKSQGSRSTIDTYNKLIGKFGTEFNVLLRADIGTIGELDKALADGIERIREEKVNLIPGYDGVFGIVDIMNRVKKPSHGTQSSIIDF